MTQKKKKKIPTKAELQQLQRLYKTDEKIGERLGGVPAYLVAYWRRKKNIPKHSQPKFSEKEINTLWERYGDDDKCGLELGISKAAFYNWRRRYGIKEKPAFLKLEQLEFNFPGLKTSGTSTSLYNKQSLVQKILARHLEKETVEIGATIAIEPDLVYTNLSAHEAVDTFDRKQSDLVWNPGKILLSLDSGETSNGSPDLENARKIMEFASRQSIKNLISIKDGLQFMTAMEKGYILPGQAILSPDKYISSFGALSALSFPVSTQEAGQVWADGTYTLTVPKVVRINISGRRARGVAGKDIALSVFKQLANVNIAGKAIEFYGNIVSQMHISERITLCHFMVESGAVTAICPFDSVTRRFLTGRALGSFQPHMADKNAEYEAVYQVNVDSLSPQLMKLDDQTEIKPAGEFDGLPVQAVVIGTENNGRFDDIRASAEILKGKQIHPDCRLFIYPATRTIYLEALKKGLIRILVEAGAEIIFPGHWPYNGTRKICGDNERALVTSNFRFAQNLGLRKTDTCLCSPVTAAAAALNGAITDPIRFLK